MALEDDLTDNYFYTVEFRIDKLYKQDMEKILKVINEFPQTQYREISKLPKSVAQKTSI